MNKLPTSFLFMLLGASMAAGCESSTAPQPEFGAAAVAGHDPVTVFFSGGGTFAPAGGSITCPVIGPGPAIYAGTGVMSRLGRTEVLATWTTCGINPLGQIAMTGVIAFTAANGDVIEGTFTQTFTGSAGAVSYFDVDPITFTGGTGRFAGVTGAAQGNGSFDQATQQGEMEFYGTMTPPGVSKHLNPSR